MASSEVLIEAGQFDDALEETEHTPAAPVTTGRPEAAYIDTVQDHGHDQVFDHEYPPTSDDEGGDEDALFDEDDEYYDDALRVEDEDWEVAERDFTKQYNRLRQHVAVRTGAAEGVSSSMQHAAVATLPAVNLHRAPPKASSSSKAISSSKHDIPTGQSSKDKTTNQLEAYAQKYNSKLAGIERSYTDTLQGMGVGVNRKGPSAHANMKDKSDRATNEQVLDPRTRLILFKMIGRGLLDEVNGCISTGKEANVYHALSPDRRHLALKIYKTSILVFKDRSKYVTGEYRFRRGYSKNPRKMVRLWAEKEMRNLRRLQAAGIKCPEPMEVRENVLVMTFVGTKEGWASPRLKDAQIPQHHLSRLYRSLVLSVRTMFHVCKLVHADLSEYNILYHQPHSTSALPSSDGASAAPSEAPQVPEPESEQPAGELWIIDVSQSVEHDHPSAFDFLRNDVKNVEDFFARKGTSTLGVRRTFEFVTREKVTQAKEGEEREEADEEALERWVEEREAQGAEPTTADEEGARVGQQEEGANGGDDRRDEEHEDSIFMKSYIPRNLNEVYDPERDVEKVARGEVKNLIYADTIGVVVPTIPDEQGGEATGKKGSFFEDGERSDSDGEGGDSEDREGSEDDDGEKAFVERKPRGHKFEDKEAKKERKRAAKEGAREKRKNKMPKAEKKKLVKKSARSV